MIAHVPGHLCAADVAAFLGVDALVVYRLASRRKWRSVKRVGEREVYYNFDDVCAVPKRVAST